MQAAHREPSAESLRLSDKRVIRPARLLMMAHCNRWKSPSHPEGLLLSGTWRRNIPARQVYPCNDATAHIAQAS
jgi:hypothetical protein